MKFPISLSRLFFLGYVAALPGALLVPCAAAETAAAVLPARELDLVAAVEAALARNFTVVAARLDPAIAEQRRRVAAGTFDPVLEASYLYGRDEAPAFLDPLQGGSAGTLVESRTGFVALSGVLPTSTRYRLLARTDGTLLPASGQAAAYTSFAGVSITQPLWGGAGPGSVLAPLRIARRQVKIDEEALRGVIMDVITTTVLAYHDLVLADQSLLAAERSQALAARLLKDNERRVELGALAPLDILQAQASLAQREDLLLQSGLRRRQAERNLVRLTQGELTAGPRAPLVVVAPPRPGRREPDPAADLPVALEQRPDFRQALQAVDIATLETRQARNEARPQLDLVGSFGYRGQGAGFPPTRRAVVSEDDQYYTLGGVLRYPLPNRSGRATAAAAGLAERQRELALAQLRQEIRLDLEAAADRVATDWARIETASRARSLAARALAAEERKLQAGTTTTFVVLQLQDDLTAAELRELAALTDYQGSLTEYDRQIGLTLVRYGVDLP